MDQHARRKDTLFVEAEWGSTQQHIDDYYSLCLKTTDPKMFLSFVAQLYESVQKTTSSTQTNRGCTVSLLDELRWYLYQYKQSSYVFRHKGSYVICTDDFETIQLTLGDVKRWYAEFKGIGHKKNISFVT